MQMAIRIVNRLITPYSDKDDLKVIWGDTQTFEFTLPSPHQAGDAYHFGIDFDRVVYPPSRPLCAYTKAFEVDGGTLTMTLTYNTGRLRDYVCKLRKPTPIYIQLDRVRGGKCETLLLDTLLALPSVLDSQNTVVEGDPLAELLEAKLDKPYAEGNPGEILSLDDDGQPVWRPEQEIPEQEQADWDESDSTAVTYIRNKPVISKVGHTGEYNDILNRPDLKPVATTGSYNDLTDKPHIPVDPVQADYDESDSTALDYIKHKPVISKVGHTGSYDDLLDKPDLSVYSLVTETGNRLSMSIDGDYVLSVGLLDKNGGTLDTKTIDLPLESMIVNASYSNGVLTLTLQNGNTLDVDISDIVSGLVPDTRTVNGHALSADVTVTASDLNLATVATSGSYDDLLDKPAIPVQAQVQSDWDESDSTEMSYIRNKPELPAFDYLCIRPQQETGTIGIDSTNSSIPNYDIEYSFDGQKWHQYEWTTTTGPKISISKGYAPIFFRGDNPNGFGNIKFVSSYTGVCMMSGCIDSLIAKNGIGDGKSNINANVVFDGLFRGFLMENTPRLSNIDRVSYNSTFRDCTALIYANIVIPNVYGTSIYDNMFNGCTNLSFVESRINTTSSLNTLYWSNNWLNGAGTSVPSSRKPRIIWHQVRGETAQGVPSGWQVLYADIPSDLMPTSDGTDGQVLTKSQSGSAWNNPGTSKVVSSSDATYTISATTASTPVLTVSSALTLSADSTVAATSIAYAEVVIDLAVGATVTAGSNLTLVDTPTAGKRNVCVVRWQGGTARLYVVDTMDIPA